MTKELEMLVALSRGDAVDEQPGAMNEAAIDLAMVAHADGTGATARALQAAFTTYLGSHLAQHPERTDEVLANVHRAVLNAKAMFEGGGRVQ